MRLLVLFILGVVLGVAVAMLATNALQQRSAYPRGVMALLQHNLGALRELEKKKNCSAAQSSVFLQRLGYAAQEIEPALYPSSEPDATLHKYADKLRGTIDQAIAAPAADCPALSKNIEAIADHCDSCHREFR